MAYKQYDAAHPDPDNDAGADTLNYIKDNEAALRDAIIMGVFPFLISRHTEMISACLTTGSTRGARCG